MLLTGIHKLIGITDASTSPKRGMEMREVQSLDNAFLLIEKGKITDFGPMQNCPQYDGNIKDCSGRIVLPSYVDSHTHTIFAHSRSAEFRMRLEGKSYAEIANAGGGILNSAAQLTGMKEEELLHAAQIRIQELVRTGTGSLEIKSGYGLSIDAELKMLRVIQNLKQKEKINIKSTFLGAHALPQKYVGSKKAYMDQVCDEMLPEIAKQKLADYIDIFCEEGYFDLADLERIILGGSTYNLKAKVHVNQFNSFGAVALACKLGALSVDHLEVMKEADYKALEESPTLAVALPLCSLFLDIPFAPAREMIDRNIAFVLASDFNPGSAPSSNLHLAFALACSRMKLRPEEAFNALTYNAAFALELEKEVGSIQKGKQARLMILSEKAKSLEDIPYWFGENLINEVI